MKPRTLTVVAPCRNEREFIGPFLDCLLAQELEGTNLEIIVADGMSEDGTREILADYARRHSFIKVIDNPGRIVPCALNRAVREATGEVIVRMDVHSAYPPDYLARSLAALEKTDAPVAGGVFVNHVRDDSLAARAIGLLTGHPFGVGGSPFRTRRTAGPADSVAFGAFRREVFERLGLFDERLVRNQDIDYWKRVRDAGEFLYLDPAIEVHYYNQSSVRGFLRQAYLNGFWCVLSAKLRPGVLRPRHLVPGAFVVYMLAALLGALLGPPLFSALGLLALAAYFLPDLVFSVQMSRGTPQIRGGAALVPVIFLIAPLYHLSYGVGLWSGALSLVTGSWRRRLGAPEDYEIEFLSRRGE